MYTLANKSPTEKKFFTSEDCFAYYLIKGSVANAPELSFSCK